MTTAFAGFLAVFPADDDVKPASPDELSPYLHGNVPPLLLQFWREVGFGSFGQGRLFLPRPATLRPLLAMWLGTDNPARIPFARSAFGDLFYWRDLHKEGQAKGLSGQNPGEFGDVNWVNVHYQQISLCTLDFAEWLDTMADDAQGADFLRAQLTTAAMARFGRLTPTQVFGFVPALALGGAEELKYVQPVDIKVHMAILRALYGA